MSDTSPLTWPYVAVGALGSVVGTGLFAWRGAIQWMEPFAGLIVAFSAVVVPLLAINCLAALFISGDAWKPELTRAALVTAGFSLIPLAAGAAWFSPTIRKMALSKLSGENQRTAAARALDDPSTEVATAGCRQLVEISPNFKRQRLLETLETRRSLAVACLNGSFEQSSARQRSKSYATILTKRWQTRAFESGDAQAACQAMTYGLEMPTKKSVGTPSLLVCSLSGPSSQLRQCCADKLTSKVGSGSALVDALGSSLDSEVGADLLGPFLAASLHQHQMDESAREIARQLGLQSPAVRRFAIQFGCSSLKADANSDVVARQLRAWVSDESCVGNASFLADNKEGLEEVCSRSLDRLSSGETPSGVLCHEADRYRMGQAMSRAKTLVDAAISGGVRQKYAAAIEQGYARGGSGEGLRNQMAQLYAASQGQGGGKLSMIRALRRMGRGAGRQGSMKQFRQQFQKRALNKAKGMQEMFKGQDISELMKKMDSRYSEVDVPDELKGMSDEREKKIQESLQDIPDEQGN